MLQEQFPRWDLTLIEEKTGIQQRHIAAPDETASDLAVKAAEKLFETEGVSPDSIDFLLLCTDPRLCSSHNRLPDSGSPGSENQLRALDFNLDAVVAMVWL